ncbi:ribonuclease E inhibitor RraB [bacterium]|nr:MAG: ribonuclease E inhibitor RraB [bacterium]
MISRLFNKIPKWVNEIADNDPNKKLLQQLSQASNKPLSTPREMNFDIRNLKRLEDAEALSQHLNKIDWVTKIEKDHLNPDLLWVTATKQNYAITEQTLFDDQALIIRLANIFDAEYDGWYASVE